MRSPFTSRLYWRIALASLKMRLGRRLYSQGSRQYPHGLLQDFRVYPWLKNTMSWVPLEPWDTMPNPRTASEALDAFRREKNVPAGRAINWHAAAVMAAQKWMAQRDQPGMLDADATFDNGALAEKCLRVLGLPVFGPLPVVVLLWKGRDGEGGAQVMSRRGGAG